MYGTTTHVHTHTHIFTADVCWFHWQSSRDPAWRREKVPEVPPSVWDELTGTSPHGRENKSPPGMGLSAETHLMKTWSRASGAHAGLKVYLPTRQWLQAHGQDITGVLKMAAATLLIQPRELRLRTGTAEYPHIQVCTAGSITQEAQGGSPHRHWLCVSDKNKHLDPSDPKSCSFIW